MKRSKIIIYGRKSICVAIHLLIIKITVIKVYEFPRTKLYEVEGSIVCELKLSSNDAFTVVY